MRLRIYRILPLQILIAFMKLNILILEIYAFKGFLNLSRDGTGKTGRVGLF